ncbi:MAG: hypothetical protein ACT4P2_11610 [Pseudomonadota bacterium]
MDQEESDRADRQLRELEQVAEFLKPILERTVKVYDHAITSLWVGNAGAALATLAFIGTTWGKGPPVKPMLWSLGFFLVGVLAMATGSIIALISAHIRIRHMQGANSPWHFRVGDIKSPLKELALVPSDARTIMAIISAATFLVGCGLGFYMLLSTWK